MRGGAGSRHLDNLMALEVRGTWRYLRAQPASFWLICAYLFFEYVRPQSVWPVMDVLPWSQTLLIMCAVALFTEGKKLGVPTVAGSTLLVFTSVLLLSSITAYRPDIAQDNLVAYLTWLLIILLVINIVTTESRFLVFMLLFLLCSFKMSQHGFREFVGRGGAFAGYGATGAPGFFHNSGEFGIQMCVFIPLTLAFIWALHDRWPRWKKLILAAFPITGLVSIVATGSRGAIVGIGVVLIWWLVAVNRRKRIKSIIWVGAIAGATFLMLPQEARDRFEEIGDDAGTSSYRVELWKQGIEVANGRPLLGVGYANWSVYYRENLPLLSNVDSILPHNIFVQAGAELGYTGLLAFLLMIAAKFKVNAGTRRLARKTPGDNRFMYAMAFGLDGAMVGYLASGFFVTVLYYPYFWINLAMTIALNRSMLRKAREVRRARGRPPRGDRKAVPLRQALV